MDGASDASKKECNQSNEKHFGAISWEEYFMGIACLSAKRSKDPETVVGACIVTRDRRIVGIGYNGMPNGCSDDKFPWNGEKRKKREKYGIETKHLYVCHAELNAITNSYGTVLKDCIMYVTRFPCDECAKVTVQSGIKEVVYLYKKNNENELISKEIFDAAHIKCRMYKDARKILY